METASPAAPPTASMCWKEWALLAVVLLIALSLRAYHLGAKSFWVDEFFTLHAITGVGMGADAAIPWNTLVEPAPNLTSPPKLAPWWAVLKPDLQEIHPTLYPFLLRLWANVFGFGEVGLRSFSVFWSLVAIAALYLIVRDLSGRGPALWAALLMALAQPQIESAQDARSYMMLLAVALLACGVVVRIEKQGVTRGRLTALVALTAGMLLTHYFAVGAAAALIAYAALRLRGRERRGTLLAMGLTAGAFFLLWGPVLVMQRHGISGGGTNVFADPGDGHFLRTLSRLVMLPARYLNEPLKSAEVLSGAAFIACLLPFAMLRRRPDLLLWALWIPATIGPALVTDLTHHSFSLLRLRYTLLASPGVYALLGGLTRDLRPALRHLLPAAAALGCALAVPSAYLTDLADWRTFGHYIKSISRRGDVTIFACTPNARRFVLRYYVCAGHYAQPLPGPVVMLDAPASPPLAEQIRSHPGVVVVGDDVLPDLGLRGPLREKESRFFPQVGHVGRIEFAGESR